MNDMPTEKTIVFDTDGPQDVSLVGGKGASLLELARANFPVPRFFIVTTATWRAVMAQVQNTTASEYSKDPSEQLISPSCIPNWLRKALAAAYERLGRGRVAVRSSAVAEDSEEASFAGQQETILGVTGLDGLYEGIVRCWASGQSERSRAYRSARLTGASQAGNLSHDEFPLAIVVQRLIAAEVAGVVFSRDPTDETGDHLLIEAAWGLGEGVVSGKVMPDRYRVRRSDGMAVQQKIADKRTRIAEEGEVPVPEHLQSQPCLTEAQLSELSQLALQVERHYGQERDVEWAFAEGKFWLLQARPITTVTAWERERYRQGEISRLRKLAAPRGTVWARYNLAESITVPTPITWAVLRHFMSGRGGYGLLLRDLGFDPDPLLDELGFLDLVCGRPYVNLSREPLCYFRHFPLWYPFEALKAEPMRALYPKPQLDRSRLGWRFWLHLPATFYKVLRQAVRLNKLAAELPDWLRQEVYPRFRQDVERARRESLTRLSELAVWGHFCYWRERTLGEFARQALRPTVVLGHLLGSLEHMMRKMMPRAEVAQVVRQLLVGVRPDPEADLAAGLEKLMWGQWTLDTFLAQFAHRGEQELELAQPRWGEAPHTLPLWKSFDPTASLTDRAPGRVSQDESATEFLALLDQLASKFAWSQSQVQTLLPVLERARECAALRETSRHYFMLGYSILRQCLLELGQRWQLDDDIFFLTPEEIEQLLGLPATVTSGPAVSKATGDVHKLAELKQIIRQRRRERQTAQTLEVPTVLFSDDLESLGHPQLLSGSGTVQGVAVSPGVAEGQALVLRHIHEARENLPPGYVLVCPSTDPAWVPLFLYARALVMETGGVLSHGAIVAREFGLPAVVGITDACQRFRTGQHLRVNGNTGEVQLLDPH